jgi:pimeloyl-ACP methyl ester carboxylesterase
MKTGHCIAFFGLFLLCSSCSVLQWRSPDAEINSAFAKANIPTTISYFEIDSLDLKIRVQHIQAANSDYNLLFLHGSPSSLSAWNGYMKDSSFVKKALMHAVDRPGYGYSNFGDALPSIEEQGAVLSALIDDYNWEHVITIGASYGGPVAARLAAINDRVEGVIMISPAIDPDNEQRIWQSSLTQWWITRWLVPTGYRVAGDEKTVHASELALVEDDWSQVTVPVMHLHGDEDDLVPFANVDFSKKHFSDIQIIRLEGKGHEIAWARPELIKPYILEMIRNLEKKAE